MTKKKSSHTSNNTTSSSGSGNKSKTKASSSSSSSSSGETIDKTASNGKHSKAAAAAAAAAAAKAPSSTLGIPLWICLSVGLLSLCLGLITPHYLLLQEQKVSLAEAKFAISKRELDSANDDNDKSFHQEKTRTKETRIMESTTSSSMVNDVNMLHSPVDYPCDEQSLSQYLHEKPVPGMHVICMNQTMRSLQLTLYPKAQQTDTPIQMELEGLPTWDVYVNALAQSLHLRPMDELNQPWAIFSTNGELLVREDNQHVQMNGLVQMGMLLLYQGGQFVWPGVRIGFQRTIQLYSVMPAGSPDMGNKQRQATLETISLEPLVFSVEGFLDHEECDFFQQVATPTLQYSQVTLMDRDKGRPASDFRTSQSTFLTHNNNHPMITDIDYRTASLVRVPRSHQENVQVLRYGGGEKYDAHHDYFDKRLYQNDPGTLQNFIQYGRRNRMITVFWYLSDVEEGGETVFPRFGGAPQPSSMSDCDTGLKVKPVRGKVIIFYSLKPDGSLDPLSLHGACPVKKGVKWAANKWVWNAPIEFGSGR